MYMYYGFYDDYDMIWFLMIIVDDNDEDNNLFIFSKKWNTHE